MKIYKHRNIMGCIFGLMLSLPLLGVLARSAYVIVNKNAYQSYSDNFVKSVNTITSRSNIINNETYYVNNLNVPTGTSNDIEPYNLVIFYKSISFDVYTTLGYDNSLDVVGFQLWQYSSANGSYFTRPYYLDNGTLVQGAQVWNNLRVNSFTFVADTTYVDPLGTSNNFWTISGSAQVTNYVYQTNKLDNVFEYSLDKVIDNNNFGNINFLEWFEDMFLSDNEVNNRYVHYFNWYLNYSMFVSCVYILFLVLMWFVNFARRLLDRGMNYDW